MALAVDAVSQATSFGSPTIPHTCTGANRLLYALVEERYSTAVTGATYAGVAMTEIAVNDPGQNVLSIKVFRLVNPASGANNVVVTQPPAASHAIAVTCISFNGADQATPNGTPVNASGGPDTSISDAIASAAGEIVVDAACCREEVAATRTLTVGAGQTERSNQEKVGATGNGLQGAVSTEPGAASVTMSWTINTADHWAHTLFSVKPSLGDVTAPANPTVAPSQVAAGAAVQLTIGMPADADLAEYEVRSLTTVFPAADRSDGVVAIVPTAAVPSSTVVVTDVGLVDGSRYFYRVFVKDTSGNWSSGTPATEVSAQGLPVVGWHTAAGVLRADGETGPNPILEWTVDDVNVEAAKPVPFHITLGDNPSASPGLPPTGNVSEHFSTGADGSFTYWTGSAWAAVPVAGVAWSVVSAGPVRCRFQSQILAGVRYGSVRAEQAA